MKIWFDGQCFQTPSRRRGIGRWTGNFLETLSQRDDVTVLVSLNADMKESAIHARRELERFLPPENIFVWQGVAEVGEAVGGLSRRRRLSQLALVHHINSLDVDIAVSTSPFEGAYDAAVPLGPSELLVPPLAAIFYDAIPLRFPDQYLRDKKNAAVYRSRFEDYNRTELVLCISDFTLSEFQSLLGNAPAVSVSTGLDPDLFSTLEKVQGTTEKTPGRLLYVGGMDWRKNLRVVPQAIARLSDEHRAQCHLKVVGDMPDESVNELHAIWSNASLPPDRLNIVGHTSDEELAYHYAQSHILLLPSIMEGFGLTALEAMASGTLVLSSKAGALSEVVGDPELLFDPQSPDELASKITRALEDPDFVAQKVAAGIDRSRQFNWDKVVDTAVGAFTNLLETCKKPTRRDPDGFTTEVSKIAGPPDYMAAVLAASTGRHPPEPKRLVIDVTATNEADHRTGIQRVVRNISRSVLDMKPDDGRSIHLSACPTGTEWRLLPSLTSLFDASDEIYTPQPTDIVLMLDSSWTRWQEHHDRLAEVQLAGGTVISCLYDFVPLYAPAFCDPGMPPVFSDWFQSALSVSNGFVCISETVARELYDLLIAIEYPYPMKVGWWKLGANLNMLDSTDPAVQKKKAVNGRTKLLIVGTIEPRKGHSVVLAAFDELRASGADVELTIVGKEGWNVAELVHEIRNHPSFNDRLFWKVGVSDDELKELYADSDVLISASYAEGFGLPIIEAGTLKKPVIVSDIPVFREVTAHAHSVSFFEPGNATSLADAVRDFIKKKRGAGRSSKQDSVSSWPNWTESTVELIELLLTDGFQLHYEPKTRPNDFSFSRISRRKPAHVSNVNDRNCQIDLVGKPVHSLDGDVVTYTGKVANRSRVPLASGEGGFEIRIRPIPQGESEPVIVTFPFVVVPDSDHYFAFTTPGEWSDFATEFLVELVGESIVCSSARFGLPNNKDTPRVTRDVALDPAK